MSTHILRRKIIPKIRLRWENQP